MAKASRYHPLLVAMHWLLAVVIVAALALGALVMTHISNSDPRKIHALRSHMTGGALILVLMLARYFVRTNTAHPARVPTGQPFLDNLAWASHRLFYVLVFAMVGSGIALAIEADLLKVVFAGRGSLPSDFWVFAPRTLHYVFSRLLMLLIAIHIAGALYHSTILRDRLLGRMWFGRRTVREGSAANANSGGASSAVTGTPAAASARDAAHGRPAGDRARGFWVFAPWIPRVLLALSTLLFARLGVEYLSTPVQIAARSRIVLGSPAAITDMRAEGAIFLALAVVVLLSLVSTRRLLAGLALLAVVIAFVTATRLLGVFVDGAAPETLFKLKPEVALLTLSIVAIVIEGARRRRVLPGAAVVNG